MKKRLLCLLICCVLALGLLPVFASAATMVNTLSITDLSQPQAGFLADHNLRMGLGYDQTSQFDTKNTFLGVTWFDVTAGDKPLVAGTDRFIAGHSYRVIILVKADDGYVFSTNKNGESTLTATVNGQTAKVKGTVSGQSERNVVFVNYTFAEPCTKQVEFIGVDVAAPKINYAPSTAVTLENKDAYQASKVVWYEDDVEMTAGKKFAEGKSYRCAILVETKAGYSFYHNVSLPNDPKVNARVNGFEADVFKGVNAPVSKQVIVSYNFGKCNNYNINYISVRGIDAPAADQSPDLYAYVEGTGYSVSSITWYKTGNVKMAAGEKFRAGEVYTVEAKVSPDLGYVINPVNAYINGHSVSDKTGTNPVILRYTFPICQGVISQIDIVNLDLPAIDANPDYTADVSGEHYKINTALNASPNYYKNGIAWENLTDNKLVLIGGSDSKFKNLKKYRVRIALESDEGFNFTESTAATVNGNPAEVEYLYKDIVNVYCTFELNFAEDPCAKAHTYDNAFDAKCNVCGAERTPPNTPTKTFTDVPANAWYKYYVDYAVAYGIFSGTSDTTFSPNADMTRAQFVQVLANISGVKLDNSVKTGFNDAPSGKWFSGAVEWAAKSGIASGVGGGNFNPTGKIDRQQMCTMLVNYVENYKKTTLKEKVEYKTFADDKAIAGWAKTSVIKCFKAGLVSGTGNNMFSPKVVANRATGATIFTNFHKEYIAN